MFITLEGIEGSGKTTQIRYLVEYFQARGAQWVTTRESGGTPIGAKIRAILLDPESENLDPWAELLLYMADRVQHLDELVKPALAEGKAVLCDRYFDATLAYQGYARGLDIEIINRLHQLLLGGLKPDITFLLDLSPRQGLARAWRQLHNGTRTGAESRFEEETLAFHEKVRAGYLSLARLEPERIRVVDASQDEKKVRDEILTAVSLALR